jgi:hypothetical protein
LHWFGCLGVLFTPDLIFRPCPYIFDADILTWIAQPTAALAEVTVLVGVLCGKAEILALQGYLRVTWDLTAQHIRLGNSVDETCADPAYPVFSEQKYERLHQANIRYMYEQMTG